MIYLDYVATTPLAPEIKETYIKLLNKYFINADSAYAPGYEVSGLIEKSSRYSQGGQYEKITERTGKQDK